MKNDYLIYKSGVDVEDIYLYDGALVDIVENSLILKISKLIVMDYWRRTERFTITIVNYIISISPKIEVIAAMKDDEERFNYIESNWKNLVRITLSKAHPEYFVAKQTSTEETTYCYEKLDKASDDDNSFTVADYFRNNYPDLTRIHLRNGYKHSEFIEYIPIAKIK